MLSFAWLKKRARHRVLNLYLCATSRIDSPTSASAKTHAKPTPTPKSLSKPVPLPVRLLVAGTSTWTTELLGLTSSVVGNEKGTVVGHESLLELVLAVLIDKLLVVGDLRECLVSVPITVTQHSMRRGNDIRCSWRWLVG
jgi:hypothetical protein